MPSEPPDQNKTQPEKTTPNIPQQSISASGGAKIENVSQTITIITRSETEELDDFLDKAMADFENRMSSLLADLLLGAARPEEPFKSLEYFRVEDSSIFFGRSAASRELHDKVVDNRLMILYARSGAGKSSLLNAGLSPLLLREAWQPVYVRIQPFEADLVREIKQAIFPLSRAPWPKVLEALSLHGFLSYVSNKRQRTKELVIILDQFEQFLISLQNKDILQQFIEILRDCYEDQYLHVRFIISLKHENLGDLDEFEQYIPGFLQNRYNLRPMNEEEIKEAITGPIQKVNPAISFEPALLDILVRELGKNVELTHLQIVCSELYSARPEGENVITTALYHQLGRIENILTTYLDKTLEPLTGHKHKVAWTILRELVSSEGANRVLRLPDFERAVEPDPSEIEDVLEYLVNNRLLRRDMDPQEKRYELAHDYLAEKISLRIGKEELENKRAQDMLQRELANQRLLISQADPVEFKYLIDPAQLNFLRAHIRFLTLDEAALKLLFESSLEHGHEVEFWIDQMPDRHTAARAAASAALANTQIATSLKTGLDRDLQAEVLPVLWEAYKLPDRSQRQQAIDTLSILEDWLAPQEKSEIRWALRRVKARQMVQRIRPLRVTAVFGFSLLFWFIFFIEHPVPGSWITIPEGSFDMGMNEDEAGKAYQACLEVWEAWECDESFNIERLLEISGRLADAWLPAYTILENEVTTAQYRLCIEADVCKEPDNWDDQQAAVNDPVRWLTWYQASTYCSWLGGRLPTAAEWEKAARGPENFLYPWGPDWIDNLANLEPAGKGDAQSVLEYAETDSSGYGIRNLAGNVREWTASRYLDKKVGDPFDNDVLTQEIIDSVMPGDVPVVAVLRGGSWKTQPAEGMSPRRGGDEPGTIRPTTGFRCVCPTMDCSTTGEPWWNLFHRP